MKAEGEQSIMISFKFTRKEIRIPREGELRGASSHHWEKKEVLVMECLMQLLEVHFWL